MGLTGFDVRTFVLIGFGLLLAGAPAVASMDGEDAGCLGQAPLIQANWETVGRPCLGQELALGTFALPLSAEKPEIITAARLTLTLKRDQLEVLVTFNDPKPFGLPFNFEGIRVSYEDGLGQSHETRLDWTAGCQNVGRSIFPGQAFSDSIALPGLPVSIRNLRVSLWGARN